MSLRRLLAVVVAAALPFASACGAGKNNETDNERATPYVAHAQAGSLVVAGIRVLPSLSGDVAGYLAAAIVNRGSTPDALTNATVAGGAVTPRGVTSLTIEPSHSLRFASPDLNPSGGLSAGPALEITALSTELKLGTTVPVTFTFAQAGTVRVDVPVQSALRIGTTELQQPIHTTGSYPGYYESPSAEEQQP